MRAAAQRLLLVGAVGSATAVASNATLQSSRVGQDRYPEGRWLQANSPATDDSVWCALHDRDFGNPDVGACEAGKFVALYGHQVFINVDLWNGNSTFDWFDINQTVEVVFSQASECQAACQGELGCDVWVFSLQEGACMHSCWMKGDVSCEPGYTGLVADPRECPPNTTNTTSTTTATTDINATTTMYVSTTTSAGSALTTTVGSTKTTTATVASIAAATTSGTCDEPPDLGGAGEVSQCRGQPSGATCEPACQSSLSWVGTIMCSAGSWQVSGLCVLEGADVKLARVLQLSVALRLEAGDQSELPPTFPQQWAAKYDEDLASAAAGSTGVDTRSILVEVLPSQGAASDDSSSGSSRRLRALQAAPTNSSAALLRLRVLVNLDIANSNLSASLADVELATHFEDRVESGSGNGTFSELLTRALRLSGWPQLAFALDSVSAVVSHDFPFPLPQSGALCPMGRSWALSCDWQVALAGIVLAALCLCLGACLAGLWLRVRKRRQEAAEGPKPGAVGSLALGGLEPLPAPFWTAPSMGTMGSMPSVAEEPNIRVPSALMSPREAARRDEEEQERKRKTKEEKE